MIKNWLVRGDTHGDFTWMTNGCLTDYKPNETAIIILGDAGFNFWLDKKDDRLKKEVNNKGYRFYCVQGNHESRATNITGMQFIYDDDVKGWLYLQPAYPNIRYLKMYGDYCFGKYFTAILGGAYSVDKWWRLQRAGVKDTKDPKYWNPKATGWFPDEQMTKQEMKDAEEALSGIPYDFVMSHTCPISWQPTDLFLSAVNQSEVDSSMELWMDEFKDKIKYVAWLFGHYHDDRLERPHVEMYYKDIESLDTIYDRWIKYDESGKLDWWLNKSPNFYMK